MLPGRGERNQRVMQQGRVGTLIHTPTCVPGAATGASTEAACPDCKAMENRSRQPVLWVQPTAPARAPNDATERRPSTARAQRRTAPRDRTWEQRDRNRLPWPVTSRHIQSAGVAGNDCLTSPCRSISHRSAPFSLLFRSTATALLGASRRVGEVTLGQRLGEMQVGRALTKADGTLTKGR